jgi:hypothetical protein
MVTDWLMPFWLPFSCFVVGIWVVISCRRPVPLQEGSCWLFAQQILPVRAYFERHKAIHESNSHRSLFHIFTLNPVGIPAVYSVEIPAVSKLYFHFWSSWNAMLCLFQIISVASYTFALISVLGFRMWIEIREVQDRFLSCGRRINRLELWFCSLLSFLSHLEVDHKHCCNQQVQGTSTCSSRCCSSCLQLQLSSRPDLIQTNLSILCLRLSSLRNFLATATAWRTCSERKALANRYVKQPLDAYVHVFETDMQTEMHVHKLCFCMHMHVFASKLQRECSIRANTRMYLY